MGESVEQRHWGRVYADKNPDEVSWFEHTPETSLKLIDAIGLAPEAAIIDVGGGASRLAAELQRRGYSDVTVADLSPAALDQARQGFDGGADAVSWIVADARSHDFGREFDLWHDRALFHFMVDPLDRGHYVANLRSSVKLGGHAILATFGPEGPTSCSGLPVRRYGDAELAAELGDEFALCRTELVDHQTPSGKTQQFLYARFQRRPETVEQLLSDARSGLNRLAPREAAAAAENGALLVDIRSDNQRAGDGLIPGAKHIPRNVLEWRLDPASPHRDEAAARRDVRVVLICNEGYQSSLAAATLRRFGLDATDVVGGFQAWREAGLPVSPASVKRSPARVPRSRPDR